MLQKAEELCGPIKQHHYREKQSFAFIQFETIQCVQLALEKLNNTDVAIDLSITAASPGTTDLTPQLAKLTGSV